MADKKDEDEAATDDGWGEAAREQASREDGDEAAPGEAEWQDPAHLDERVAALHEHREQPPSLSGPVIAAESEDAADPEVGEVSEPADGDGHRHGELSDDDLPPWKPDDGEPGASSDLLEASGVIIDDDGDAAGETDEPGASRRKKKRSGPALSPRQKLFLIGGAALFMVLAACAVLGYFNSQNYYLRCGARSIAATQGSFWPWGEERLSGKAFQPVEVPSDVLCTDQHFNSRDELEMAFLSSLLEQSTALLTSGDAEQVARAEAQLEQALLLTRDPERKKDRTLAKRLQGDVSYWRGAAEIKKVIKSLQASAKHFEEAAARRPRHASDASAWAEHALFIQAEIDKGPRPLRVDEAPKDKPHFQGLGEEPGGAPETPGQGSAPTAPDSPAAAEDESNLDAGLPAPGDPAPPADASLPKGGVLL